MRAIAVTLLVALAACNDLREFAGPWRGTRVGDSAAVRVGVTEAAIAELTVEDVDTRGLRARLSLDDGSGVYLAQDVEVASLAGAEADALATMTFAGSPLRVYMAFVPLPDGGGDALALIGLYDSRRIDLRLLRGGAQPIYAIFALSERD